jgi:hypothetical protein
MRNIQLIDETGEYDFLTIKRYKCGNKIFVAKFYNHSYEDEAYVTMITPEKKIKNFLDDEDLSFDFEGWHYDDYDERKTKPDFIRKKERKAFFKKVEKTLNIICEE